MKSGTKKVVKIIISLLYILWGLSSPILAFKAVLALDIGAIASATVGILTLLAGIFGLFGMKKMKCRAFGIVIFVCSLIAVALSVLGGGINISSIITAVLAWLFIVCL